MTNSRRESSGYFVYDEQYVHIDRKEKNRAVLKDSKTGNFVESKAKRNQFPLRRL